MATVKVVAAKVVGANGVQALGGGQVNEAVADLTSVLRARCSKYMAYTGHIVRYASLRALGVAIRSQ